MRVAAVYVPRFSYLAELGRRPHLSGRTVLITDSERPKLILDTSPDAAAHGVRTGMAFRQAMSICPNAVAVPADHAWYREAWESLLDGLEDVSPEVEDAGIGRAFLKLQGLDAHYRDDLDLGTEIIGIAMHSSFLVAIGIAEGKFPALAAAIVSAPGEVTIKRIPIASGIGFIRCLDADHPTEVDEVLL